MVHINHQVSYNSFSTIFSLFSEVIIGSVYHCFDVNLQLAFAICSYRRDIQDTVSTGMALRGQGNHLDATHRPGWPLICQQIHSGIISIQLFENMGRPTPKQNATVSEE